jgi:hypothetical protein
VKAQKRDDRPQEVFDVLGLGLDRLRLALCQTRNDVAESRHRRQHIGRCRSDNARACRAVIRPLAAFEFSLFVAVESAPAPTTEG